MIAVVWGKFILLLVLIYIFGVRASKSADIIAEKKGLAKAFMGVVFISMLTSFPELFTGISSVAIIESADFAVGEILGSCIFNLLIIAIIEISFRRTNFYKLEGKINLLPSGFSFILITLLTFAISIRLNLSIFNIGFFTILIFILYFVFLRIIFIEKEEKKQRKFYDGKSLKKEIISFIISSIVIIGVGIYLPIVGNQIAGIMGWGHTFVGTIFFAFITSFPELVVSYAAAKIGAFDMMMGNIAGSNLFNIAIIFILDIFYIKGALLHEASDIFISVGIIAILMNFIVFFALVRRSSYKFLNFISLNAIILFILYIINFLLSYKKI